MSTYPHPLVPKAEFVRIMREHAEADRLVAGIYGDGKGKKFRGCAIGCGVQTINRLTGSCHAFGDHAAVADALGIPLALAHLEDRIFEGLPEAERKAWPIAFAKAIPEGRDLAPAVPRILIRTLREVALPAVTVDEWGVRAAVEGVCVALETGEGLREVADAADHAYAAADAADAANAAAGGADAYAAAADAAYAAGRAAYDAADAVADAVAAYAAAARAADPADAAARAAYAADAAYRTIARIVLEEIAR